jgi:hypothetical protein
LLAPFVSCRTRVIASATLPVIEEIEQFGFVAFSDAAPSLDFYVEWPNVNPALASTFIAVDCFGYVGG